MHGTLAGGSAFRVVRKACRKLKEIMQAAEDGCVEVYACRLEEFTLAGDTQCCRKTPLYREINQLFSLNHAMWDSCGHLGGRPRCITVYRRGVRSLAFLGQFCPTISIKLSTAKVR